MLALQPIILVMQQTIQPTIQVALPDDFDTYTADVQALVLAYLSHLDAIECKAYMIGKEHLGTSFNVLKSNGFNEWKKEQLEASLSAYNETFTLKDFVQIYPVAPACTNEYYQHKKQSLCLHVCFTDKYTWNIAEV